MSAKKTVVTSILVATFAASWASDASAVGTRRFVLDSMSSFEGGELEGVSLTSDGTVQAGWVLSDAPIADASSVWSSVVLDDGTVLLGTGTGGRIYRVKNGKVDIAAETGAMAVSALVVAADGDVIAGTFPEGKLFKASPKNLDGKKLEPFMELEGAEDIWDLAVDPKSKALYAATGPEGKLFRITGNKPEVFFDSEDPHLVSVAVAPDGAVYTGSNGKALLFKLSGPGRASVVHDFEGDDVKDIAVTADGVVYAIANDYRGANKGLRPPRPSGGGESFSTGPTNVKSATPGRGVLMRFDDKGVAEQMLQSDSSHFVTLALDDEGRAYVGTGHEGRVYTVSENHVERMVVDTEERSVGALAVRGKTRFVATSDPVVFHVIQGTGGPDATWTSQTLDAGLRAHFGRLDWRADGNLELETRSGNTEKPDSTWSAWSKPLAAPGDITSPPGRYLQIRGRWAKDPKAVLYELKASFVTDNGRALITSIDAGQGGSSTGGSNVPASGGGPDEPSTNVSLSWKVDNPDNDKLRYRVFYRRDGDDVWFPLLESSDELTKPSYTWDTAGVPEGRYRVKIEATDELSNPPDRVTRHSLVSQPILVDNTAPQLTNLALTGNRLTGTATDLVGPIAHFEFALVGKKTWWPIFPTDLVFDEATESFDVDVSSLVPQGPHLVVVRAYDQAGNSVEKTVSRNR